MSLSKVEGKAESANKAAIARKIGVEKSHVRHILRGTRVPSLEVAAAIARELGVSLDDFYRYYLTRTERALVN